MQYTVEARHEHDNATLPMRLPLYPHISDA